MSKTRHKESNNSMNGEANLASCKKININVKSVNRRTELMLFTPFRSTSFIVLRYYFFAMQNIIIFGRLSLRRCQCKGWSKG